MSDFNSEKVSILIAQKRYKEAEPLLKALLSNNPEDVFLLAQLAQVYIEQDRYQEARLILDQAIGLSPDNAYLFYERARALLMLNLTEEAETAVKEAVRLEPDDADYRAYWAFIHTFTKDFEGALELANGALALDAGNVLALNVRSTVLIKLKRIDEADQTMAGALSEDPNNAYTHANYGWNLLEQGEHRKALNHFKEALAISPDMEYAQEGMMEALKASNLFYRLYLKYYFFMGNLTEGKQWAVIIGFYVGNKVLRILARTMPSLSPFITPLVVLLVIVALSTWVMKPIGNLFLRFNKYGRYLLSKEENNSALLVAGALAIGLAGMLLWVVSGNILFSITAFWGISMMVPLSQVFNAYTNKYLMPACAVAFFALGIAAQVSGWRNNDMFNGFAQLYAMGFVGYQFLVNYLVTNQAKG